MLSGSGRRGAPESAYAPIMSRGRYAGVRSREAFPPAYFAGWLSFAAALAIGVLVGWLIWG